MHVTVLIATRNRAPRLGRTLESLAASIVPNGVRWDVVVVDNGSTDATADVVGHVAQTSGIEVLRLWEPEAGVSRARNAGLRAARGEVIAFTDDDVRVDRHWLGVVAREFASDPALAMMTGRVVMISPALPNLATKDSPERAWFSFPCHLREIGSSVNMAARAHVLGQVGGFDPRLGYGAGPWASEDRDLMYRILRAGFPILYCPESLVYHDPDRTTPEAVRRSQRIYTRSWGALLAKHTLAGDRWMAGLLRAEVSRLSWGAVRPATADRREALHRLWAFAGGVLGWSLRDLRLRTLRRRDAAGRSDHDPA
jgi:glycosyltransferase involved in cell wall biosynthesis